MDLITDAESDRKDVDHRRGRRGLDRSRDVIDLFRLNGQVIDDTRGTRQVPIDR